MGNILVAIGSLAALTAVTLPFVFIGCKVGDGVAWIMTKILRLQ